MSGFIKKLRNFFGPPVIHVSGPLYKPLPEIITTPDKPKSFGYKTGWLTIKSEDPVAVIDALNLTAPREANWETGIFAAYECNHLFVTPPISGWVMVIGGPITSITDEPHQTLDILSQMCNSFGEAQFFLTHRIVEYHIWGRLIEGKIIRAYCYSGEKGIVYFDVGEKCEKEKDFGIYIPDENTSESEWDKANYVDEEHVMKMAGIWSLDPTLLGEMDLAESTGFLC